MKPLTSLRKHQKRSSLKTFSNSLRRSSKNKKNRNKSKKLIFTKKAQGALDKIAIVLQNIHQWQDIATPLSVNGAHAWTWCVPDWRLSALSIAC
jgi:hypothetical protein